MASNFNALYMDLSSQLIWLFILPLPISCVAWIVTHEEIFREPREYCQKCSKERKSILMRKFFYIFTCEYCFSFYVTVLFLALTRYKLLIGDWRGYIIAGFALVWLANIYMSLFFLIRTNIKREGVEIKKEEKELNG